MGRLSYSVTYSTSTFNISGEERKDEYGILKEGRCLQSWITVYQKQMRKCMVRKRIWYKMNISLNSLQGVYCWELCLIKESNLTKEYWLCILQTELIHDGLQAMKKFRFYLAHWEQCTTKCFPTNNGSMLHDFWKPNRIKYPLSNCWSEKKYKGQKPCTLVRWRRCISCWNRGTYKDNLIENNYRRNVIP